MFASLESLLTSTPCADSKLELKEGDFGLLGCNQLNAVDTIEVIVVNTFVIVLNILPI
jgi:hypothetical protein